ncbi:peroxiredoxin type-2 [Coemansia sp. RSA 2706]|nr:peroxiredoxin type-2 [Coemansia sp. RSA 2711]KAJ1849605.1 peroxiredoxin type-2 [Coemansia sp. RSA 2708]KAJ2287929.1 peroxiredoxin type-2 [Coemansia sp. RSA 2706]KAJ2302723.1 peroxiredoxin type-2 [Coemansia sp. RSA 2705]KAJ2309094.1 peroxiredoxin type-2 [Coemansia sp. RSA 2704]KAJ2314416.1 peroxiredoxin type-2 [Coemansia sp. RSA 2702]KAJ2369086.1 peroxiredoxin type-2 [Coemansia sp. RSA 2610]KAJ2389458.1 peroxiredoxin type-2 [Coemansia sp. RSA 2611]KAJ2714897.1 peroxiredoxin type-2 [Coeman
MVLKVGDEFPQVQLKYIPFDEKNPDACTSPQVLDTKTDFAGKKVLVIGVPGAFSPTCSIQHLPAYVAKIGDLKAKHVDKVVCVSGDNFFVMSAWGKSENVKGNIIMAGDANGELGRATGLALDLAKVGMGAVRLTRFAAVVDNGKVSHLAIEPDPTDVTVTGADSVLAAL